MSGHLSGQAQLYSYVVGEWSLEWSGNAAEWSVSGHLSGEVVQLSCWLSGHLSGQAVQLSGR